MIGTSLHELIFIRICIFLLQYSPFICLLLLVICLFAISASRGTEPGHPGLTTAATGLAVLLAAEALFAIVFYFPHKQRLSQLAVHPEPLGRAQRQALFARCAANVPDGERYLRWWFLGADPRELRRDNVRDFFRWGFFGQGAEGEALADRGSSGQEAGIEEERGGSSSNTSGGRGEEDDELEDYLDKCEALVHRKLPPGRGNAQALRLTIDKAEARYHSVLWYVIVGFVDTITHLLLLRAGYTYMAPSLREGLAVFPPRLQVAPSRLMGHKSASDKLGYWFRPHTARGKLPVVFLHGIGIGLWAYASFLAELGRDCDGQEDQGGGGGGGGQIGVVALELLPISMRLTAPPLSRPAFVRELSRIIHAHGWDQTGFVLVSHSYGSVLTTHVLRDPTLGPLARAVVLVDPVSLCLHLPDVAYNFTRRRPRRANEWQLWYFASMDMGVAGTLGRHFFWQENVVWKDELLWPQRAVEGGHKDDGQEASATGLVGGSRGQKPDRGTAADRDASPIYQRGLSGEKRRVAVSLAGQDLIVDTLTVAKYLVCAGDLREWDETDEEELHSALARRSSGSDSRRGATYTTRAGIEMFWFPTLDHAQVFDAKENRGPVLDVVSRFSSQAS